MAKIISDPRGVTYGDALRQRNRTRLQWRGNTTDATPKEIFLDGLATSDGRLVISTGTILVGEGNFIAYNSTDDSVRAVGRFAVSLKNVAGTVSAEGATLEWDAASTDANPFVQFFTGAGVAFTYDNTNKALVLTVTGVASKNISWIAELDRFLVLPI